MPRKHAIGDLVGIQLDPKSHAYARVLGGAAYAFYDKQSTLDLTPAQVQALPIAFFAAVMDTAKARWERIGIVQGLPELIPPPRFIQDPLRKTSFSLYWNDGTITPASEAECHNLERASVWFPDQMEERLRDHFAGRQNPCVEAMKLIPTNGME